MGDDLGNCSPYVLLTGAGYSKNYGGYLASEFRKRLLRHKNVQSSDLVCTALLDPSNGGFEDALGDLKGADDQAPYHLLEEAVFDIFTEMDNQMMVMKNSQPRPFNDQRISRFLSRFSPTSSEMGFIFTLNQDLVLEREWYSHFDCHPPALPGILKAFRSKYFTPYFEKIKDYEVLVYDLGEHYADDDPHDDRIPAVYHIPSKGSTNIIKLHGSFNWRTEDKRMLILGRHKSEMIEEFPLLVKYRDLFHKVLTSGNIRLFVIGYGFQDSHINETILEAVKHHGLKLWIMDRRDFDSTLKMSWDVSDEHTMKYAIRGYIDDPFSVVFEHQAPDVKRFHPDIENFFSE